MLYDMLEALVKLLGRIFADSTARHYLVDGIAHSVGEAIVDKSTSESQNKKISNEEADQKFVDLFSIDSKPVDAAAFSAFAAIIVMVAIVVTAIITRNFSISLTAVREWVAFGVVMFFQFFSAWMVLHAARSKIAIIPLKLRGWACFIVWLSIGTTNNFLWTFVFPWFR